MKILHINTHDIRGGAARAAFRIHTGLLNLKIESAMAVAYKDSDHSEIFCDAGRWNHIKKKINAKTENWWKSLANVTTETPWSIGSNTFHASIENSICHADVLHLHWINSGFIDVSMLHQITSPIVWTLHDMWPFTGGCHYVSEGCSKFQSHCCMCEQLIGNQRFDLCSYVFRRKEKFYPPKMFVACPSRWIANEAKKSALMQHYPIYVIPNGLDTSTYAPQNKRFSRQVLGLPENATIILFGAISATTDERKGFQYLYPALQILQNSNHMKNMEFMVFGSSSSDVHFNFPVHYYGFVHDDISLKILYSAADVMIVPSKLESFGQTVVEAMACGTPVVAFHVGGIIDIIDHKINGYMAEPYSSEDLAAGIQFVLEDGERYRLLSANARKKVVDCFREDIVAQKYIALYESILHGEE